jgi:hypothetical protein
MYGVVLDTARQTTSMGMARPAFLPGNGAWAIPASSGISNFKDFMECGAAGDASGGWYQSFLPILPDPNCKALPGRPLIAVPDCTS